MSATFILPNAEDVGNEAKRVVAAELEAHRKREATLPRIAQRIQQNEKSNVTRMAAMNMPDTKHEHPGVGNSKVSQDFLNRFAAARRGAMLGGGAQSASPRQRKSAKGTAKSDTEGQQEEAAERGPKKLERRDVARLSLPDISKAKVKNPASKKLSMAAAGRVSTQYKRAKRLRVMQKRKGEAVRPESRVGKLLAEFQTQEDWVAQTILKHKLASILQANVKGWLIRKKWTADRHGLVASLHKRLAAEAANELRRVKLRQQLEERKLKHSDSASIVNLLFGKRNKATKNMALGAGSKWGKLQASYKADLMAEQAEIPKPVRAKDRQESEPSSSESEFSDLEMEDIATVKLRAATPPWQRMEESLWLGQYNKLGKKSTRAKIEASWDLDQSRSRLLQARERRMARDLQAQEEGAQQGGAYLEEEYDPATQKLSSDLVHELLYPAYMRRFARMGLLEYNPLDLPPSMAAQGSGGLEEEEESGSEGELMEEGRHLYSLDGSRGRSSKHQASEPFSKLRADQDKSPEALAAELDFPVGSKKRPSVMAANAARAQEAKQEVVAKMSLLMQEGLQQGGRRPSYASGNVA